VLIRKDALIEVETAFAEACWKKAVAVGYEPIASGLNPRTMVRTGSAGLALAITRAAVSAPGKNQSGPARKGPAVHSSSPICSINPFISRTNAANSRRSAIASAVKRPCLKAWLLPFGAPGEAPPSIPTANY
jgi:hypothetical protein